MKNQNIYQVISLLANGESRSGQEIGAQLNITRSAVWKIMHKLAELGIPLERHQGKGYKFKQPLEMLDQERIVAALSPETQRLISSFEIVDTVNSTNDYLHAAVKNNCPSGSIVLSEYQTAGRARQGKKWHAPYAANIYLSAYWHFIKDPTELAGLSLALSIAIVDALDKEGVKGLQIKWPNDIYHNDKKIAGILIDISAESNTATDVIIGIGVNVSMPEPSEGEIDQPWTDIQTIIGKQPDRNRLIGAVLNGVFTALPTFAAQGFAPFVARWPEYDMLANQTITLTYPNKVINGIARGIGEHGELQIESDGKIQTHLSGTVRKA